MSMIDLYPFMENAVAEVLEAMCFISVEGITSDKTAPFEPNWIYGELDFTGDWSGTFGIAVPPATAATIAANFLGEEEAVLTPEITGEAICELTNMVCGTLLAQADSKSIFALSPPRPGRHSVFSDGQWRDICRVYALDEGFIHAWIEMKAVG